MTEHADRHHDLSEPDAPPRVEPGHPTGQPHQGTDREIDTRVIYKSGIALLVVTVLAMAAMWLMVRLFQGREARTDRPPSPLAEANERRMPPGPLLQVTPEAELQAFREEESRQLTTYGWIDRSRGVAHIPIERAMELVLANAEALGPAAAAVDPAAVEPAAVEPAATEPPATEPPAAPAPPPGGHR